MQRPIPAPGKNWNGCLGHADFLPDSEIKGYFVGPRKEMITPWSTNAVEIAGNMGIAGVRRIEEFFAVTGKEAGFDPHAAGPV
jgi:phosphoribosylformylglycinamidine synthase